MRWYETALRLLPERDDTSATRLRLPLASADALGTAGRLPDAAEVLVRARTVLHRGRLAEAVAEAEAAFDGVLTIANDMFCTTGPPVTAVTRSRLPGTASKP